METDYRTKNNQGLDTIERNHDTMPVQFKYEATKIMKKPRLDLDNRTEKSKNSKNRKLSLKNVGSQSKITQFCGLRKVNTTTKASTEQSTPTTSRAEDSQGVSIVQSNLTPSAIDDSYGLRKVNTTPKTIDSQEVSTVQSTPTTSRAEDSQEVPIVRSNLTPSAIDDSH